MTTNDTAAKDRKSRSRFSGLFSSKHKDQQHDDIPEEEHVDQVAPEVDEMLLEPPSNRDSAYGSSNSNQTSSAAIPTISKSQADQQDAPTTTRTNPSTGRTVTTTTTTTTTTVTTTDGEHYQVPAGKEVIVSQQTAPTPAPAPAPAPTENIQQPAPTTAQPIQKPSSPPVPARSSRRSIDFNEPKPSLIDETRTTYDTPVSPIQSNGNNFSYPRPPSNQAQYKNGDAVNTGISTQHGISATAGNNAGLSGNISPEQNYNANSTGLDHNTPGNDLNPTTTQQPTETYHAYGSQPGHHQPGVYSVPDSAYRMPSRRRVGSNGPSIGPQPGQPQKTGMMDGLKTAVAGIHGAGESLRGAFNSSVERRMGGDAETIAAHEAVAERGRQEISTGRLQHGANHSVEQPAAPPVQPPGAAYGLYPRDHETTGAYVPPPGAAYQGPPSTVSGAPAGSVAGDSTLYGSSNGESVKKKGGIRNVLRRKSGDRSRA